MISLETFAENAMAPVELLPHHRRLLRELQFASEAPDYRVIITMPHGSGKTTYAGVIFAAWLLEQGKSVIGAVSSVARFVTQNKIECAGRYYPVAVGGATVGRRADMVIIDDPIISQRNADSGIIRSGIIDWINCNLLTRLRPNGSAVLIMRPWDGSDFLGELCATIPQWHLVNIEAVELIA